MNDSGHEVTTGGARSRRGADGREQRLLDAAAALLIDQGYDRTTVADIAAAAGVSKGAVYLHFTGKDALLDALVLREMKAYARAWVEAVEADPDGGRIGGMYRCALKALAGNPIMSALLRRDQRLFGAALRRPGGLLAASRTGSSRQAFVEAMQQAGALRRDLDPAVTAHILNMLSYGLVSMAQVMDPARIPPLEPLLEGIADLLERALAPAGGGDPAAGKAIVRALYQAGAARPSGTARAPGDDR
jgi:TetR/AcrR family acrAB operon transcriptional repressor